MSRQSKYLSGKVIDPPGIAAGMTVTKLIDSTFLAYNAGRLREACQLYGGRMLEEDVTIGLSLTGALTPAGLARSAIIPLIEAGFVDWIVSTGANLYHDTHFGIGKKLHQGNHAWDDAVLREEQVIRIYDIVFDYDVLLSTDKFFREILSAPEFQKSMSTAEMHYLCGKYLDEREKKLNLPSSTLLAAAYRAGVPVYTSSPGDSSIGMNVAALALAGKGPQLDITLDVNETAPIVLAAKRGGGKRTLNLREVVNGVMYVLSTGRQWRCIPKDLPPRSTVHGYFSRDRPKYGGDHAAIRNERRRRLMLPWSASNVPLTMAVRTWSIKCAPRGDQRICRRAPIRRCSNHCTAPSVGEVENGSSSSRADA